MAKEPSGNVAEKGLFLENYRKRGSLEWQEGGAARLVHFGRQLSDCWNAAVVRAAFISSRISGFSQRERKL